MDGSIISILGKVLIFDYDQTDVKLFDYDPRYQYCMSKLGELGASHDDSQVTVFVISTKRLDLVGYYEPGHGEAWRASFDIYSIQWPEKKALGMHTIVSDPPQEVMSTGYGSLGPTTGNLDDITQWIISLLSKTTFFDPPLTTYFDPPG